MPSILTEPGFFLLPRGESLPPHTQETGLIALLSLDGGNERVFEIGMTDDLPRELALDNDARATHYAVRPIAYSPNHRVRLAQIQSMQVELSRLRAKYVLRK